MKNPLFLQNEEEEERSYQSIVGKRNSPLNSELFKELSKYEEAQQMALESNATLDSAIEMHLDNLRVLAKPLEELQKEVIKQEYNCKRVCVWLSQMAIKA